MGEYAYRCARDWFTRGQVEEARVRSRAVVFPNEKLAVHDDKRAVAGNASVARQPGKLEQVNAAAHLRGGETNGARHLAVAVRGVERSFRDDGQFQIGHE